MLWPTRTRVEGWTSESGKEMTMSVSKGWDTSSKKSLICSAGDPSLVMRRANPLLSALICRKNLQKEVSFLIDLRQILWITLITVIKNHQRWSAVKIERWGIIIIRFASNFVHTNYYCKQYKLFALISLKNPTNLVLSNLHSFYGLCNALCHVSCIWPPMTPPMTLHPHAP